MVGVSSGGTYPAAGVICAEHGTTTANKSAAVSAGVTEAYLCKFMLLEDRPTKFRGRHASVSSALTVVASIDRPRQRRSTKLQCGYANVRAAGVSSSFQRVAPGTFAGLKPAPSSRIEGTGSWKL